MDKGKIESAIATMEAQIKVLKLELAKLPTKEPVEEPVEEPAEEPAEKEEVKE